MGTCVHVKEYYDRRSAEYDETAYGAADDEESRELERLRAAIASLPSVLTLDVACGTGYLTRHLQGQIVGLDQRGDAPDRQRATSRHPPRPRGVDGTPLPGFLLRPRVHEFLLRAPPGTRAPPVRY
jgi:SAM-dependent methyltransferase